MSGPKNVLTASGVPEDAIARLQEMRQNHLATSNLSTNEFLLVRRTGFRPLGFVMGVCYFHIKGSSQVDGTTNEAYEYTQALYAARELAMSRMQAEAERLGAHTIVEVHLDEIGDHFGEDSGCSEFFAIGTAVRELDHTHEPLPPTMTVSLDD